MTIPSWDRHEIERKVPLHTVNDSFTLLTKVSERLHCPTPHTRISSHKLASRSISMLQLQNLELFRPLSVISESSMHKSIVLLGRFGARDHHED